MWREAACLSTIVVANFDEVYICVLISNNSRMHWETKHMPAWISLTDARHSSNCISVTITELWTFDFRGLKYTYGSLSNIVNVCVAEINLFPEFLVCSF